MSFKSTNHQHFKNLIPIVVISLSLILFSGIFYKNFISLSNSTTKNDNSQTYFIKRHKVYYQEKLQVYNNGKIVPQIKNFELTLADPKTFQVLSTFWAKDKSNIYFQGQIVNPKDGTSKADISTFTFLASDTMLAKDATHVYSIVHKPNVEKGSDLIYEVVPGADPDTFTILDNHRYAKDKAHVYYVSNVNEVEELPELNPESFRVLGVCGSAEVYRSYYATDGKSVVAEDKIIPDADGQTFRIVVDFDNGSDGMSMSGTYAVDKNHVYKTCGEIVPTGDPKTCSAFNLQACE